MDLLSLKKYRSDRWFLIGYGLYLSIRIFSSSFFIKEYPILEYILITGTAVASLFIGIHFIVNYLLVDVKTVLQLLGLVLVVLFVGYADSGDYYGNLVIHMIILTYLGRDIPFEKIAKTTIAVSAIVIGFIVLSSFVGIITNFEFVTPSRPSRFGLGFVYTLYAPNYLFNITALYIYIRKRQIRWIELLLCVVPNVLLYIATDSRLTFVFSLAIIAFGAVYKAFPEFVKNRRLLHRLTVLVFPICTAVSLLVLVIYDSSIPWLNSLNISIEGRLSMAQTMVERYGISMFGKSIDMVGSSSVFFGYRQPDEYIYVDNLYVQSLLSQGIIVTVLFLILLTYATYRAWKIKDYYIEIILCLCALHALLDDIIYKLHYNTFWFVVVSLTVAGIRSFMNRRKSIETKTLFFLF